jgi:hypothetical protein
MPAVATLSSAKPGLATELTTALAASVFTKVLLEIASDMETPFSEYAVLVQDQVIRPSDN